MRIMAYLPIALFLLSSTRIYAGNCASFVVHEGKGARRPETATSSTNYVEALLSQDLDVDDTPRRCCLQGICIALPLVLLVGGVESAIAEQQERDATTVPSNKKPYAPIENLLPATRVKLLIDRSVESAKALEQEQQANNREKLFSQLEFLLLEPRSFLTTKDEVSKSKRYLEIDTLADWTKARQDETRQQFFSDADTNPNPLTRLNEGFEQWGERRQFQRLRRQQISLERANPLRAAFNAYTNNLVFGDSYLLTASREDKSRMIRTYNQLPDVTSVIRSDLDLRDLYRNEVLTAVDDARAELKYQQEGEQKEKMLDPSELIMLLQQAQSSCNKWFEFVPESDVKEAMSRILAEGFLSS